MSKRKTIETLLTQALLQDGEMAQSLYEYELEEHIDYWYEGLKADRDEFVFVVTENTGHVAMALIMADKTIYVNEDARAKLSEFWQSNYSVNMKRLIPMMVDDLMDGYVAVNGVKTIANKPPRKASGKSPRWVWGKAKP